MLKRFDIKEGGIVPSDSEHCPILVFVNPEKNETTFLTDKFQLDEHTVHSALDPDELSRLEFEQNHFALIFKRPRNYSSEEQFLFKVSSIGIFMFKDKMIILISEDVPLFDGRNTFKVSSLLDVMLKIFYRSIAHFLQHLKVINMISDEIEQKVNASMENRYLIHMFTLEKSLVYYLNAVNYNTSVLEKLRNASSRIGFSSENMEFLEDILIENSQCHKQIEIYSNIISSLMDARASIVSNNLNVMMKNLNALVIAVAVPSFFAGMGGMSEFSMMSHSIQWYYAYPIFLIGMLGLGIGTFFIIKRIERYWKY
jgi:magnesium transporter